MSTDKVLTIEETLAADNVDYAEVEAYKGGKTRIGTLCSADIIEWIEDNDAPEKKRFAGLRLLVKSLVGPNGERIPREKHEETVKLFEGKDARSNGKVIKAALELNGLRVKVTDPKTLGEAPTATSPSDSPQPAE